MEHVRFPVEGMTCTSCVAHITKAVRKIDGVDTIKVDLGSDSAAVAFDPSRTSLVAIGAAIEAAGYAPDLIAVEPWVERRSGSLVARLGLGRHREPARRTARRGDGTLGSRADDPAGDTGAG